MVSGGTSWANGDDDHFMAVGEHNFSAQSPEELSFSRSQRIIVAPKGTENLILSHVSLSSGGFNVIIKFVHNLAKFRFF